MTKVVQVVGLVVALAAGVVIGVKYSESLKNHFSWMSESKDEVALPDLSNEEIDGASGENQDVLTNGSAKPVENAGEVVAPMDSAPEAPAKK